MEAALHFHCQWTTVERSIRTAVERAYKINPILLCKIAGYPLTCIPTVSYTHLDVYKRQFPRRAASTGRTGPTS